MMLMIAKHKPNGPHRTGLATRRYCIANNKRAQGTSNVFLIAFCQWNLLQECASRAYFGNYSTNTPPKTVHNWHENGP